MNDHDQTIKALLAEIEQLREENNLLKAAAHHPATEKGVNEISTLETQLARVMQGDNEKLAWWELEIATSRLTFDQRKIEILGYPPDQFKVLIDFTALIHPDDYDRVMEAMNGYIEGALDKLEVEYRIRSRSGEYFWLFKYGSIVTYENGKPQICAGFVYNITDRKKVEEALYKSEQMFQAVMDNFPGVIFWKDTESRFLGCNQAFAARAGLNAPSEIVGKTDAELPWGANDWERFRAEDLQVIESGQPSLHIEEIQHKPNGEVGWFDKNKISLRDVRGRVIGVIGVANDITKLKETEQQLIDINNELVHQNQDKAAQAVELKLALAKAEESDRLKSEFLANMSHEIRTPMNSILGFAELLKDPELTPWKQEEYLLIIEKSIERMANIITDVVDYSRIEAGQMNLYFSDTNVDQEIETIFDFYQPEAGYKGIEFLIKTPLPSQVTIHTDRDKLYAILANLVKNAIKFTRAGSIEVGYEKENDHLEFFVKDTGIGVKEEQKDIIFKRFRQGSESENKKYEGAGLGLSIAKAYVEALGGRIWVESDSNGNGSVFYFTLPLNEHVTAPSERELTEIH